MATQPKNGNIEMDGHPGIERQMPPLPSATAPRRRSHMERLTDKSGESALQTLVNLDLA